MKRYRNPYILIFTAVILWSLSGLLVKTVKANAIWITLIRSIGGGFFLLPYAFKEKIFPIKNLFLASFFMTIFLLALTITTQISSSAMAISMQYTAPIYAIVYNLYRNKKISFNKILIFIFIFLGILFNIISSLNEANSIAIISGLIIGISFLFYSYNLKKITKGNPLGIIAIINIISSFFYILILIFNYSPPPVVIIDLSLIIISGIVISGISYALYSSGLRRVNVEKALIICLIEPVLNPIWVYLGNGEIPDYLVIIGMFFILLGAFTDILFNKEKRA